MNEAVCPQAHEQWHERALDSILAHCCFPGFLRKGAQITYIATSIVTNSLRVLIQLRRPRLPVSAPPSAAGLLRQVGRGRLDNDLSDRVVVSLPRNISEQNQLPLQEKIAELDALGSLQHRGVGDTTDI